MTQTADLFGSNPSRLDRFWSGQIAEHVIAMAEAVEAPQAMFAHSKVVILGVEVMMHIGPGGLRGVLPEDWKRVLDHISQNEVEVDIGALSFGVLQPPKPVINRRQP